jgi:NADH-quinone oxidoreductase subunit J
MSDVIFVGLAMMALVSAVLLVTRRNPLYAGLCMLVLFGTTALLFLQLAAPFLAAMQVLVYGGAVLMLFMFTIMLLNLHTEELGGEKGLTFKLSAGILAVVLAIFLVYAIKFSPGTVDAVIDGSVVKCWEFPAIPSGASDFGSAAFVGKKIFAGYLLPFELVSVLVVAALAGAIVLTKKTV